LKPYGFSPAAASRPAAAESIAEFIRSVETLASATYPLQPYVPGAGQRGLACGMLRDAAKLLDYARSPAFGPAASGVVSLMNAGRYDIAASIDATVERLVAGDEHEVREQLKLGAEAFERVKDSMSAFERSPMARTPIALSFAPGGGIFQSGEGIVQLDPVGIRRLVAADLLLARGPIVDMDRCASGRVTPGPTSTFCANMRVRFRAETGRELKATKAPAIWALPRFSLTSLYADWRARFGPAAVEAYLDEVWSFAVQASSPEGAVGGVRPSEATRSYLNRPASDLVRQLRLVVGHELGHLLLRHVAGAAPSGPDDGEERCVASLQRETQADVLGALLLAGIDKDAWRPADDDEVDRAGGTDVPEAFGRWSPFFDGYVGLFETNGMVCEYYTPAARQLLLYVLFTLQRLGWKD
jgi:hypothetical protein